MPLKNFEDISDEFLDKRFPDSRIERIFANMEFDTED